MNMSDEKTLTIENSTFNEWHGCLNAHAQKFGGHASDADAWTEEYDAGKTPEQAWFDEWGEK
jgi:hypothetical protein